MNNDSSAKQFKERRALVGMSDFHNFQIETTQDAEVILNVVKITAGDWHVSTQPGEMIATILGSCVSACIRDPIAKIGGMNHFLLPGDESTVAEFGDAARYGIFAMESLINGILRAGGRKDRLEVKVFG